MKTPICKLQSFPTFFQRFPIPLQPLALTICTLYKTDTTMVSFSCENCNDTIVKKKLPQHRNKCPGAPFTCLDCQETFHGNTFQNHTSCISEAQKYEKTVYKQPNGRKQKKEASVEPLKDEKLKEEAAEPMETASAPVVEQAAPVTAPEITETASATKIKPEVAGFPVNPEAARKETDKELRKAALKKEKMAKHLARLERHGKSRAGRDATGGVLKEEPQAEDEEIKVIVDDQPMAIHESYIPLESRTNPAPASASPVVKKNKNKYDSKKRKREAAEAASPDGEEKMPERLALAQEKKARRKEAREERAEEAQKPTLTSVLDESLKSITADHGVSVQQLVKVLKKKSIKIKRDDLFKRMLVKKEGDQLVIKVV
ncbi:uncharacterized protein V1518DRAFT_411295 [Limtongia smithiae]|uniref:uncharacterized protein n=1 Tax=Limtongia smithiae TaxID=1125753 RepID=UPI0034CFA347